MFVLVIALFAYADSTRISPTILSEQPLICLNYITRGVNFKALLEIQGMSKRLFGFWQSLREGPRAIVRRGREKSPPRGLHRVRSDTRAPRTLRGGEGTAD